MNSGSFKKLEHALTWLKWWMTGLVALVLVGAFGGVDHLLEPKKESVPKVRDMAKTNSGDLFVADVENGIHIPSGMIAEGDFGVVLQNCLACHSSKLIIQNRMNAESWRKTIRWMQETQNLWDLGENEDKIVAYLGKHYAPIKTGRRKPLVVEEWYTIE